MKTIVVADDNAPNRELISAILEGRGYRVIEAGNGRETIDKVAAGPADLLLLDIHMPELDGFGVVRELRRDPRFHKLPIVALTASAMRGDAEQALTAGFDAYLAKPYEISDVLALVNRVIGGA